MPVVRVLFVFFSFNLRVAVRVRVPFTPRDLVHHHFRHLINIDIEQQAIVSFPSCATIRDSLICLAHLVSTRCQDCVSPKEYPPPSFKHEYLSNSQALVAGPGPDPDLSPICFLFFQSRYPLPYIKSYLAPWKHSPLTNLHRQLKSA